MVSNIQCALEVSFAGLKALHLYDWKLTHQKMRESQFQYNHGVMIFTTFYYLCNIQRPFKLRFYVCEKCTRVCNAIIKCIVGNKKEENRTKKRERVAHQAQERFRDG